MDNKKREELIKEIEGIIEKFEVWAYSDDELIQLRACLQPSVDGWNDCETELQYLVDLFGNGIEEYNFDNYITNKNEERLINDIKKQTTDVFTYFIPKETIEILNKSYIEHKVGCMVEIDYKNYCVIVYKDRPFNF